MTVLRLYSDFFFVILIPNFIICTFLFVMLLYNKTIFIKQIVNLKTLVNFKPENVNHREFTKKVNYHREFTKTVIYHREFTKDVDKQLNKSQVSCPRDINKKA